MKYLIIGVLFVAAAIMAGCGKPGPMSFEEQQIYMAKQQCAQEATNMAPGWPSSSNPYWNSYFVMCMNSLGITDQELNQIWY